jgi:osmotically-inducible protein OsmY
MLQTVLADEELERRVENFLRARGVHSDSVEVKARDGVVILRGSVRSTREWEVLLETCRRVAGALHVIDELSVVGRRAIPR